MRLRTFLKPFSFLPALVMMYLIYSFSAQEGSDSAALSYKVSYYVVKAADEVLDADLQEWEIENFANRFHGVTRKLAHMTEYFALAISVAFPLYVYGLHGIPLVLTAGMICVAYACGDEYHQSFVAGRSPSKRDVLIDSFGAFWGIILVRLIGWTGRMTIFRPLRRKRVRVSSYYNTAPQQRAPYGYDSYGGYDDYDDYGGRSSYDSYDGHGGRGGYAANYNGQDRRGGYTSYNEQDRRSSYDSYDDHSGRGGHASYDNRGGTDWPLPYEERHRKEPVRGSDKLSEDLSFRKLLHDIREQHQ